MTFISVRCPYCHSDQIVKRGTTRRGTQRYLCQTTAYPWQSFLLEHSYQGRLSEVKPQSIAMSLNASGRRDTARVLRISTDTVLRALRKKRSRPRIGPYRATAYRKSSRDHRGHAAS